MNRDSAPGREADAGGLATKALADLRVAIEQLRADQATRMGALEGAIGKVEGAVGKVEGRLTWRLFAAVVAIVGLLFAALRLWPPA